MNNIVIDKEIVHKSAFNIWAKKALIAIVESELIFDNKCTSSIETMKKMYLLITIMVAVVLTISIAQAGRWIRGEIDENHDGGIITTDYGSVYEVFHLDRFDAQHWHRYDRIYVDEYNGIMVNLDVGREAVDIELIR